MILSFFVPAIKERKRRRRERWERGITLRCIVVSEVSEDGLQSQDGALR